MFKLFSTITLSGLLTLSAAHAQSTQPIRVRIPFAFTVQNTTLKSGTYQMSYSSTAHILSIRGLDRQSSGLFATASPVVSTGRQGKLIFHCYDKSCYLTQLSQPGDQGLKLRRDEQERKLALLARIVSVAIPAK